MIVVEALGALKEQAAMALSLIPLRRRLEKALARAFIAQGRDFLNRLEMIKSKWPVLEEATPPEWEPLFDETELATMEVFRKPLDGNIRKALRGGALANLTNLKMRGTFNLENPRAVEYLQERAALLVTGINETTKGVLKKMIVKGADKGWAYTKLAKAIKARYKAFAIGKPQKHIQSRAHLVAVTELANAYETGNFIVAQDLQDAGLEIEKRWVTVGDDRVSDGCAANEADGWIPLADTFGSGHLHALRFPGCRCHTSQRRKGAIV